MYVCKYVYVYRILHIICSENFTFFADYFATVNFFDKFLHMNTMIAIYREGLFRNKNKDVEQRKFFNTNNKHIQYMCMYISGPVLLGYIPYVCICVQ